MKSVPVRGLPGNTHPQDVGADYDADTYWDDETVTIRAATPVGSPRPTRWVSRTITVLILAAAAAVAGADLGVWLVAGRWL